MSCLSKLTVITMVLAALPAWGKARILRADWNLGGPKIENWRPSLEAWVQTVAPGLGPHDFVLHSGDDTGVEASAATPFKAADTPLSIVILVQGSVRFLGNPDPVLQPGETTAEPLPGEYDVVKQAIDLVARARTQHTRVALWVYGEAVGEKVPLGAPEAVTGEALGPQKDYAQVATRSLEGALDQALTALAEQPGRRVIFLIGDGGARHEDYDVRKDVERLAAARIEVYTLGASPKAPVRAEQRRFQLLGQLGGHRWADQKEQVVEAAEALVAEMNGMYVVTFPGLPTASNGQILGTLPFDGGEHEVKIKAGADETADLTLRFPGPYACLLGPSIRCVCDDGAMGPPCRITPHKRPIWPWLLGGAALLLGGLAAALILRRPSEADPDLVEAPPVVAPPPPVAAPAPPVVAPARNTIMIDPAGEDDEQGFPLVAWIVPVNGNAAFQTFRLKRKTLIGAANDCDVRLDDPSMSGHHAEIIQIGKSYVLLDAGARNGVHFSGKRIERHPLVDNDKFTLGATDFKFKSTLD